MSSDHFIQQYTADQIPFYVHMRTGETSWTLPAHAGPDAVKFITHLTDQGVPYYEDVELGSTSWTLPLEKLSTAARRNSMAIKKMDRRETDAFMAEEAKNNKARQQAQHVQGGVPSSRAGITSILEDDEESVSDTSGSRQEAVSRAPFSVPQQQAGSESENNTDHSSPRRSRAGSSSSASGRASTKVTSAPPEEIKQQQQQQQQGDSRRFSNMASLSAAAHGSSGPGAFSDDESESNTTATTATTASSAGPDQRALRALKRKESLQNAAGSGSAAPVVRGKSSTPTPEQAGGAAGGGGSNIVVQKAMVRSVFERYCEEDPKQRGDDIITPQGLQELCLDYGTYLSLPDVLTAMQTVGASFDGVFQYEEFMVWWRNNPFSQMKKGSPEVQKKFEAAAAFKIFDPHIRGSLTRQEFTKLHREISRAKLTTLGLDDCIGHLDSGFSGVIHFNDFIQMILHPPAAGGTAGHVVQRQEEKGSAQKKGGSAMSKFFGAFSSKKTVVDEDAEPMVAAKEHADYAKYFRLVEFGGNIVDVREQMRQAGLDDAVIHSPDKLIPAKSVQQKQESGPALKKASAFGSMDAQELEDEDFDDDESDGMDSHAGSMASGRSEQRRRAEENAFTNAFKKKTQVAVPAASEVDQRRDDEEEKEGQEEQLVDGFDDDESDGMGSHASSRVSSKSGASHKSGGSHKSLGGHRARDDEQQRRDTDSVPGTSSSTGPPSPSTVNVKLKDIVKNHSSPVQEQHEQRKQHQHNQQEQEQDAVVEVFIRKPLGLTLGENEPDEPLGVHVSKVVEGGNADSNGQIKPGMLLLRACGENVTAMDFDEVMDILRDAPKDRDLCLVFKAGSEEQDEPQEELGDDVVQAADENEDGDYVEPDEEGDDEEDEEEEEDEENEDRAMDFWSAHEQQNSNVGQEEGKEEPMGEVNIKHVNEEERNDDDDQGDDEDAYSESSDEEVAVKTVDPLARANSMFGGLSDSDASGSEVDDKVVLPSSTQDEGEDKDESEDDRDEGGDEEQEVVSAVLEDSSTSASTSPTSTSSSFRSRRLLAMKSFLGKKPAANPSSLASSTPAAQLQNDAIIGRARVPPRRSPSMQRTQDGARAGGRTVQPLTSSHASTSSAAAAHTGLPKRKKSITADANQRRYARMLGGDEDEAGEVKSAETQKEEGTGLEEQHLLPPDTDTASSSPEHTANLPRRKRSIVLDPNERRYDRMFSDDKQHPEKEQQADEAKEKEEGQVVITSAHPELRMGTLKKTASGYSLSGLSIGSASSGSAVSRGGEKQKQPTSAATSTPLKQEEEQKPHQSAALPRRHRGGNLTSQLKTLRSRRALGEDACQKEEKEVNAVDKGEKEGREMGEKVKEESTGEGPVKRRSRSGKILNKQLNILWKQDGKEVIQKHKEEEKAKACAIIKDDERVRPEEFRRRRQSFTATAPLLPPEEMQVDEEQQSLPSAIEEASHSESSAASSFSPLVTHKPISTFEMSPSLSLPRPQSSEVADKGHGEVNSISSSSSRSADTGNGKSKMAALWGKGHDSTDDCSSRGHSGSSSVREVQQAELDDHQEYSHDRSHDSSTNQDQQSYHLDEYKQPRAAVETVDTGCQSDYVNLIDEKYLNSYQMLLGEKQEVSEMQERLYAEMKSGRQQLREEEEASMARVEAFERESFSRVAEEEALLRARMEQVEDIILSEKQEIDKQWAELRAAEQEAYAVHAQKTQELLDLMHLVSVHHEKVQADKKKIARQRLHLDMALQDINRFTKFSPDMSGKIGTVKYVNTRSPAIGPSSSSTPSQKGFNSSATRLMPPSPAHITASPSHKARGGFSPSRRTSSLQSLQSFGSPRPTSNGSRAMMSRSQI